MAGPSPRASDQPVRRYRALMAENPDWAWKRVEAHVREFTDVVKSMPQVPPKSNTARELRGAIERIERLLADDACEAAE
jgi:hypothetical protein